MPGGAQGLERYFAIRVKDGTQIIENLVDRAENKRLAKRKFRRVALSWKSGRRLVGEILGPFNTQEEAARAQ